MKKDDLTQVKYIGPSRMKLLNECGILSIRQLNETPLEKLAQIETIGGHYAKLIKEAVAEYYGENPEELSAKNATGKERKIEDINRNLRKQIKNLNKRLKKVKENLKPLGNKKYLALFIEFKKTSGTFKSRLEDLKQIEGKLSKKAKKQIMKKASALDSTLKNVGKKPKKKKYIKVTQEIKSFSKMLRDTSS